MRAEEFVKLVSKCGYGTKASAKRYVKEKEGQKSHKVSDLSEFWNDQKNIVLLDPNMFACRDWKNLSQQLIDSKAWIDFSQGCDIRIMTEEKAEYIKQMKI